MTTSPDQWATVERLYHAALAQPVDGLAAFLADPCAGDEELRREVESLLAQDVSADAVLRAGAVAAAVGLVSEAGGTVLTGRRFYIAPDGRLMAVPIRTNSGRFTIEAGVPVPLFATHLGGAVQGANLQQYAVSPDGRRFLMSALVEPRTPAITVILNWRP
jgi:hypothetical protein